MFVSASERVEERAVVVSIDRSLGVESRGGFLGTGGGGLRFGFEVVGDDAMDDRLLGGFGSCERLGFRGVWVLVEVFLTEGLRVPSVEEIPLGS